MRLTFMFVLVLLLGGCLSDGGLVPGGAARPVPETLDIGTPLPYHLSELERYVIAQYYEAKTTQEAVRSIPSVVELQLTYKPDLWGLHIAYGYLLDHLMKNAPGHPLLRGSITFYSQLLTKYPNNDVVLYWAARAHDRQGLEVDGLAAEYYRRAITLNGRNSWYLSDYVRGPALRPATAPGIFFRARAGDYRPLFPVYEKLIRLARTAEERERLREDLHLLESCQGRRCDFQVAPNPVP